MEYGLNENDTSFVAVKLQNEITLEANICSFYYSLVVFLRPVKYLELSVGKNSVPVLWNGDKLMEGLMLMHI